MLNLNWKIGKITFHYVNVVGNVFGAFKNLLRIRVGFASAKKKGKLNAIRLNRTATTLHKVKVIGNR